MSVIIDYSYMYNMICDLYNIGIICNNALNICLLESAVEPALDGTGSPASEAAAAPPQLSTSGRKCSRRSSSRSLQMLCVCVCSCCAVFGVLLLSFSEGSKCTYICVYVHACN